MKERGILFSAPMVRALLAGTKTQTRRALKPQPHHVDGGVPFGDPPAWAMRDGAAAGSAVMHCPYGKPGERLWVRESFSGPHHQERHPPRDWHSTDPIHYWADGNPGQGDWTKPRPGMFMPRRASRITLEITGVRVERLQDISEADCIAEGAPGGHGSIPGYGYAATPVEHYRHIWEAINGASSWDANPWVFAITFKRVEA